MTRRTVRLWDRIFRQIAETTTAVPEERRGDTHVLRVDALNLTVPLPNGFGNVHVTIDDDRRSFVTRRSGVVSEVVSVAGGFEIRWVAHVDTYGALDWLRSTEARSIEADVLHEEAR